MNKIAVFFGTGYEEIEALTVVDILRRPVRQWRWCQLPTKQKSRVPTI